MLESTNFDQVYDRFLSELKATAASRGIVLHEDAIAQAKAAFVQTCLIKGLPSRAIAKAAGQRYVLKMIGEIS